MKNNSFSSTRVKLPRGWKYILGIIVLVVIVNVAFNRFYEVRLHGALGYGSVYTKQMVFELLTRYIGAVIYAGLAMLAIRPLERMLPKAFAVLLRIPALFLGWVIGYGMWSLNPTTWYLFFMGKSFGKVDPLFHIDLSFYVYRLDPVLSILGRIAATFILFAAVRAFIFLIYIARHRIAISAENLTAETGRQGRFLLWSAAVLFALLTVIAVVLRYRLALVTGPGSFLFGPGFVTAKLTAPIFSWLHIAALALIAVTFAILALRPHSVFTVQDGFVSTSVRAWKRPLQAIGLLISVSILTGATGALVNGLYVHPNQNTVELPYIKRTIDATRWALGINNVKAKTFTPSDTLSAKEVKRDQNALENVRVNDQGQTTSIYNQLQSFKSYFDFPATSVDRYGGKEVYISAREMDVSKLPVQTWVNKTLVYTHGYGVAASPVNHFDVNGLPQMWAKNTPQATQSPIPKVTQPNIYFGLMNNNVIAPSKQPEFDYPVASADHTSHYKGGYGLPIRGNRLFLAVEEGSLKFYTSSQFTNKSQWLFDRNIYTRVKDIAPFLSYDNDAYPFIGADGHIKWMLDAYTESASIPYAQNKLQTAYIRNSVKVVMDAYTGKVTFYVVNKQDPIIRSLMAIYPHVFTTKIPAYVRAHFRYPKDLFQAQAQALTRYHMTNPAAFYNQEDLWSMANQIYNQNQTKPRPPVYQMIRMPDQNKPQFVLSALFTPANKDNLNGWLIADNEPGDYGTLSLYQFPQSKLIFGPMQAENQIDSDPVISSQLTLWNQQGSHVIRGDLLLIPVGNSILYVEPVYLVANRSNSLPQLERVIVEYNKHVYINHSLGAAVQDLLKGNSTKSQSGGSSGGTSGQQGAGGSSAGTGSTGAGSTGTGAVPGTISENAKKANQLFQQYRKDTASGNYQAAGKDLTQLGQLLSQMQNQTNSQGAATGGGSAKTGNSTGGSSNTTGGHSGNSTTNSSGK
ncbi:UPF0182 family protein [Alicyclobacillus sp. SO9]|uniref:UPF0182 family protein n=1 Tax=Alicyclobacillus sp. SO9 TaxID=2665646 RepID=UPI0018E838EC|nr:UPF0182 family protein [Alicyclobacillus sp. SO9]QQE79370.1 UPF0182 family protein [Alicyclobacillus sp. SO9]